MTDPSPGETEPARLRTRAWLAHGSWNCDQGFLELSNRRLRFVTDSGEVQLDVDVKECSTAVSPDHAPD
jgi:hypothetical protein